MPSAPLRAPWKFVLSLPLVLVGCGDSKATPKPDVAAVPSGAAATAASVQPETKHEPQPGDKDYVRPPGKEPTPTLIKATSLKNLDGVKGLLDTNVDPNVALKGGLTALHIACGDGSKDIALLLLEKGANPNVREEAGATPLHLVAAANGNVEIATALLAKGAEVDAKDKKGQTPLMAAASNGHVEILDLLLQHKADPNIQTEQGGTALMAAVSAQKQEAVATLLASGAKVNLIDAKQSNALHYAADNGNRPITELLIANGADVLQKSEEGGTAFQRAAFKEHEELAKYLQDLEKAAGGTGAEAPTTPEKPAQAPAAPKGQGKKSGGKKKPQQPPK